MKRILVNVLLMFLFSPGILFARVARRPTRADSTYSAALAAANQFLHAWQTQDHETGILMLTDAARQHVSRNGLQQFFSPAPNAAFEIQHGKRINGGEYVFPVVLFGASDTLSRAHAGKIVLVRTGKNEWAVDRLP